MIEKDKSLLLTDLYQLTMLGGYYQQRMEAQAVFEFFVRDLPAGRNFLIAAGLEQLLEFLEQARFSAEELQWLSGTGRFSSEFIDHLADFRFCGDVDAMAEGTVCFPYEPLVRITAPLPQAQLVESRLINIVHLQSILASKAARCVLAAPDKLLVDFGLRRAHGAESGLFAARASYLSGFSGTATVLAGYLYDIPLYGTMAHSFIQAHDEEIASFAHFAEAQPGNVVLLIDTYDTEGGAHKVVDLAPEFKKKGILVKAVRLDSGDLAMHARKVRRILDNGGLGEVRIFSSGDLDEWRLQELLAAGAPIDGFGVGTKLDTSADAPYLDCAYKLMEYAGIARRKKSEGKAIWPGRKQVFRRYGEDGRMAGDTVTLEDDPQPGEALLLPFMRNGERLAPAQSLVELRNHCRQQLALLPGPLRRLDKADNYPVAIAASVRQLAKEVDKRLGIG